MRRGLIYWAAGVLCFGMLATFWVQWSSDPFRNKSFHRSVTQEDISDFAVKYGRTNLPTVPAAVTPVLLDSNQTLRVALGGLGMQDDEKNRQLADLVTVELSGASGLELVERQSIDRVLHEQDMSLSGFIRAKDALRLGKLLKADWFLFGTTALANGTNSLVMRLVDAKTGTLRNIGVLPQVGETPELAKKLALFVRESRQDASRPKKQVYLAIGAFEDLSVNNRQANFPAQLRGHLISAFQKSDVTLLEREHMDELWKEIQLDLAGLTEDSSAGAQPLQSTCWIVSGIFQSYENNGYEVEVQLNIANIFGLHSNKVILRGPPEEALFRQIQQTIETEINRNSVILVPTRRTEMLDQLELGKDLFDEDGQDVKAQYGFLDINNGLPFIEARDRSLSGEEAIRRSRNLQEAIRAFQTVMILDPTNREARIYIAVCLQNPTINRRAEAREYYRQILDEPVQDKWTLIAKMQLSEGFDRGGPWEELPWYAEAAAKSSNSKAKEYFQEEADAAGRYIKYIQDRENGYVGAQTASAASVELAKTNLLAEIKDDSRHLGLYGAMEVFADTFGTNQAAAARALADFLPEIQARYPELDPHLEGAVASLQVDTNAPIIAAFRKTLEWCVKHPDQIYKPEDFWSEMHMEFLPWCYEHACFEMAGIIVAHEQEARASNGDYYDDQRLILAIESFEHEQWGNALRIFQCYSNRPVILRSPMYLYPMRSQWVDRSGPVLTGRYTAICEHKLGLPHINDPRQFEMGKRCLALDDSSVFTTDSTGLWVAGYGELSHLDFELKPNLTITLPVDTGIPFTCICVAGNNVYVGTDGGGLLQANKASGQCRQFTINDGLLMNSITQLHPVADDLWIGYGHGNDGGLGKLAMSTDQIRSYMPAFNTNGYAPELVDDPFDGPPRHPVYSLASLKNLDILALVSGKGLQRYFTASNSWASLPDPNGFAIEFVAANNRYLVKGVRISQLEVEIESNLRSGKGNGLPAKQIFAVSQEQFVQATARVRTNANLRINCGSGKLRDQGGLEICDIENSRWLTLRDINGLPNPPETMAWDGDELWVGGAAFIAKIDLQQAKVRKFSYTQTGSVRCIQIGGGFVWAQYNGWLHRVSATDP